MAKASFPYAAVPLRPSSPYPQGTIAYRPSAFITVTASNGESIRLPALADSGADACLFPLTVAIMLKLDVLQLPRSMTGGVGSQSNVTYYDTVTIDLGQEIAFDAYVGFTEAMNAIGLALLGQSGFFEKFNVEFLHKQRVFTIEAN